MQNVETVIAGKREAITAALTVLLAEGHLLIEDVPGVGKTMLAKALARSVDCTVSRIQFTPDLLPSDVTGVSVFDQASRRFEFKRGPVFANIVIGDEINRASPKTQSALLECMEERQVTADGTTYRARPAVHRGRDPEPGRDGGHVPAARGAARPVHGPRLHGLPVVGRRARDALDPRDVEPARPPRAGRRRSSSSASMIAAVQHVFTSQPVKEYAVELARATRDDRQLRLGASPRATLQLIRAAKAHAAMHGRDFVLPDDVDALAVPVLAHRLVPTSRAVGAHDRDSGPLIDAIVRRIVGETPVPVGSARRN